MRALFCAALRCCGPMTTSARRCWPRLTLPSAIISARLLRAPRLLRGWQEAMAMRADADTARPLGTPAGTATHAPGASPGSNGASAEAKRPPEFPIRLELNITPAMAASLGRMHRRLRLKEAVIGRLALMQYLATQDPQYRED